MYYCYPFDAINIKLTWYLACVDPVSKVYIPGTFTSPNPSITLLNFASCATNVYSVVLYDFRDVWNKDSRLFVQQFTQPYIKWNIKGSHHSPFVRRNHRWPMDSSHKGPSSRGAWWLHHRDGKLYRKSCAVRASSCRYKNLQQEYFSRVKLRFCGLTWRTLSWEESKRYIDALLSFMSYYEYNK